MAKKTDKLDDEYSFTNEEYGYLFCPIHKHYKSRKVCGVCEHADTCKTLAINGWVINTGEGYKWNTV